MTVRWQLPPRCDGAVGGNLLVERSKVEVVWEGMREDTEGDDGGV